MVVDTVLVIVIVDVTGVIVTMKRLLQSARWAADVAAPNTVPVTALAQLSALHEAAAAKAAP